MIVNLNRDETSLILDSLAQLPMFKVYNLFNRLLALAQEDERVLMKGTPDPESPVLP